ncbi:hypothetical protein FH972_025299 [Carpinus fangiana]|uniref:NADH-ubiquinone oxidoreductase chain 4 n=1 Tax=Carpinus fangiana TaxID=176857 RepID=A0A5N6L0M4_9ROSI|nr:hypothetical protein FH972_025299 [Carpinus fangiana]
MPRAACYEIWGVLIEGSYFSALLRPMHQPAGVVANTLCYGISLFFVILTTFLIPICILVGWSGMRSYGKEYITASLIREFLMIAVFRMLDPLLFYVLPESVPIPMLCGAEHLLFAGIKLFLCRGLAQ